MKSASAKIALVTGAGTGIGGPRAWRWRGRFSRRARRPAAGAARGRGAEIAGARRHGARGADRPAQSNSVMALFARSANASAGWICCSTMPAALARAVPMEELTPEEWQAVVDVNLTGAFLCTQQAILIMKQQDPARRPYHQQRLDIGSRPAAVFGSLYRDQACDRGAHEIYGARRTAVRHRLRPDRHRQRAHAIRRHADQGNLQPNGTRMRGTHHGSRRRRAGGGLHCEPAARIERADHDGMATKMPYVGRG